MTAVDVALIAAGGLLCASLWVALLAALERAARWILTRRDR